MPAERAWVWRGKRRDPRRPMPDASGLPLAGKGTINLPDAIVTRLEVAAARVGLSVGRFTDELVVKALAQKNPARGVPKRLGRGVALSSISISGGLHRRLRERADRDGVSMASIVERVVDLETRGDR